MTLLGRVSERAEAELRDWVAGLKPVTVFRIGDLPVPAEAARPVMRRLVEDEDAQVVRLLADVFIKEVPQGSKVRRFRGGVGDWRAGLLVAGPGAGVSSIETILLWGLTTQVPSRAFIAAPYEDLLADDVMPRIWFESRSNLRRRDLTWGEASLLEMVRYFDTFNEMESWDAVLEEFDTLRAVKTFTLHTKSSGLPKLLIRKDAFAEVAEAEQSLPAVFHERVRSLLEVLPDSIDHETWNREGRYPGRKTYSYNTGEWENGRRKYVTVALDKYGRYRGKTPGNALVWETA